MTVRSAAVIAPTVRYLCASVSIRGSVISFASFSFALIRADPRNPRSDFFFGCCRSSLWIHLWLFKSFQERLHGSTKHPVGSHGGEDDDSLQCLFPLRLHFEENKRRADCRQEPHSHNRPRNPAAPASHRSPSDDNRRDRLHFNAAA